MQKIMFSDKFGLTQAVLEGRKTMTRRIVPSIPCYAVKGNGKLKYLFAEDLQMRGNTLMLFINNEWHEAPKQSQPKYNIGETVAVAQSYENAGYASDTIQEGRAVRKSVHSEDWDDYMIGKLGEWYIDQLAGWNNKMFTYPEMMPNQIRITDIKVERLQDISDEDCLAEGIFNTRPTSAMFGWDFDIYYSTPREAFADLIDKVSGKGTWYSNPYVVAYSFELVQYKNWYNIRKEHRND